jgi:hypothetical protein
MGCIFFDWFRATQKRGSRTYYFPFLVYRNNQENTAELMNSLPEIIFHKSTIGNSYCLHFKLI